MANLRALGDIQRRGLEAANLVVSRLISQVDEGGPLFGAEPPGERGDADRAGPGIGFPELFGQYASMMYAFVDALLGGQRPTKAPDNGASANGSSALHADPLVLSRASPGGRSEGELWLHNRSGAGVADVRVHCADLRRHDGAAIPSAAVAFDPQHLQELPDLTSRGVRVTVDVPADIGPGTYRGTVLAANLPDVWIVAELEVVPVA